MNYRINTVTETFRSGIPLNLTTNEVKKTENPNFLSMTQLTSSS